MNFEHDLEQLKNELGVISDLQAAAALLDWDMRTYMTPGAIESRAFQLATLEEVAHARAVSAELGHRIDRLAARCPSLDSDSDERRLIEKVRRNFERERVNAEIRPKKSGLTVTFRGDCCTVRNETEKTRILQSVRFRIPTENAWDSQLGDSLRELVSFRKNFPFVSFFNFGETLLTGTPIREVLWDGMWTSLLLMVPIFFGELIAGIVLAMLSAVFRNSWVDRCIMVLSVAGMSISYLVLIIFCQWLFGYYWNLFPVWGWDDWRNLALPVIVGILSGTGGGVRFYRTVFLNEIGKPYLRTALAKGDSPFRVYFGHLLKNAAIPILTRASTVLPFLFTGSLLLESFFGIPGLGFRGVDALNSSDLQTLKALVILSAFLFVFINLLTDLAYAWVDPRVRPK